MTIQTPVGPKGTGRRQAFDEKSRAYGILAIEDREPRSYTWALPYVLNQGANPYCVGYSCAGEVGARPSVRLVTNSLGDGLYYKAQRIDREEGRVWDVGASVLAGAKALMEQGYLVEYRWAFGERQLATAVSWKGPAVVGIRWPRGMSQPDSSGYVHWFGDEQEGHAVLVRGYNRTKKRYLLHNSWSPEWGGRGDAPRGCAWMDEEDMADALADYGDAMIPMVRK